MERKLTKGITFLAFFIFVFLPLQALGGSLLLFSGAATKPVMDEVNKLYAQKTGVEIIANFGGGKVLSHTG